MSSITGIAAVEVRRFLRDRSNIFIVFIFPLLLVLLLGSQFGSGSGQARVALSGGAGTELEKALRAQLQKDLEVVTASQSNAQAVLQKVRASVETVSTGQRQQSLLESAGIAATEASSALEQAQNFGQQPWLDIVDTSNAARQFQGLGRSDLDATQQLLLFVFLSSLTGAATLIKARRLGIISRVMAGPVSSR